MYRRILAFDFDGTLAKHNRVPILLQFTLEKLNRLGHSLFLVTGRRFEAVDLEDLEAVFAGIVWENGAVLSHPSSDEIYLPFGNLDARLIRALERADVPLEYGIAIVATSTRYEEKVWHVISQTGIEANVVQNKGALMIQPAGSSKGTGLSHMLELCGLSARNVVSFGDGENDLSFLKVAETGIAVADAVPSLKKVADWVTKKPGPDGVEGALARFWLQPNPDSLPTNERRAIVLGRDEGNQPVTIPTAKLAKDSLGIFGDSGTGKSWVTGLMAEGMHLAGYQVFLIDPEGDYRGLRTLPGIMAISGNDKEMPAPAFIATLLEEATTSIVLDLCQYPVEKRHDYVVELLYILRSLKAHKYRPHWIVLEEAQQFIGPTDNEISKLLLPTTNQGGWAFVSYRPDRLLPALLKSLDQCLLTRMRDGESVTAVCQRFNSPSPEVLAKTPHGNVWLCGNQLVHLRPAARRVPHVRHLYKYLDLPLPPEKRFHFRNKEDYLSYDAASLFEFKEILAKLPLESLTYHHARGDFVSWVKSALGDKVLSNHLEKLTRRDLSGEDLRKVLLQRVIERYVEVYSQARH